MLDMKKVPKKSPRRPLYPPFHEKKEKNINPFMIPHCGNS